MTFVYFEDSVGLAGNMDLISRIRVLQDAGHKHVIVVGDFNCDPQAWAETGLLDYLGMALIVPGDGKTCNIKTGRSCIDYIIVSHSIAHLMFGVHLISTVSGGQHLGVE